MEHMDYILTTTFSKIPSEFSKLLATLPGPTALRITSSLSVWTHCCCRKTSRDWTPWSRNSTDEDESTDREREGRPQVMTT
ncbi:hypothetical protein TNCV_2092421 [Trichonephila clavipes]|nr:hypothetical protein TNCV_2092421 [Trichonephila clavipes]